MKMPRLARIATGAIKINQGVENQPWSHGSREVHIRPLRKFWRRRVINRAFTGPAPFNSCFSYLLNMLIGWYHSYHIMSIGIVYFFKSFCARLDTPTARAAGFPALLFVNPRLKIICGPRAMNRCGPHLEELFYTHRFPCRFVWPFPAPHSDPSANVFSSAIAITVPYPICWPSPGPGQSEIHPAGYGPESLRGSQCPAYPESCCLSCAFHHHDHVAITSCVKDLWQRLSNMNRKRQVLMISTIHAFW